MVDEQRQLSDRLARGDREALAAIYSMYGSLVFAVALKLLRDRAEAEELVQETFLEAWRRAAQYQPERANVAAWLVTITRSRAIDRLRTRGTSNRTLEVEGRVVNEPPARPDDQVDTMRVRLVIRERVAQLPPEQRRLLEVAWDEGLSQSEIAALTGLPLGTVKTRTRNALMTLHAELKSRGLSSA